MNKFSIDDIANFCKRKGFVFPSSEIYGGLSGFWDFGPNGVELINNLKKEWWHNFVHKRDDIVGIDASIISHPNVWKASGHVSEFKDIAVKCKKCKKSTKLEPREFGNTKCDCGGVFEKIGEFDQLFRTTVGSIDKQETYLRGETAQGMFVDFKLVTENSRMRLPFGIAQIGKCFRNEISPRNFLFRSREFTIAELEYFVHPEEEKCFLLEKRHLETEIDFMSAEAQEKKEGKVEKISLSDLLATKKIDEWQVYWIAEQVFWLNLLGLNKIRLREHKDSERSFYSSATFDIDFEFPFGFNEITGNSNRDQYDLKQHIKESGKSLEIFDERAGKKVIPKVIEPTFGIERIFLALISNSIVFDKKRDYIVLKLPARVAPIKAAVLPIVKVNKEIVGLARDIYRGLKEEFNVVYDENGSIGRRYARNDEIGTPFCITVDGESLKDNCVTIRNRDTTIQRRVGISELKETLKKLLGGAEFLSV